MSTERMRWANRELKAWLWLLCARPGIIFCSGQRCSFYSSGFQPNFCCVAWTWFFAFLHASIHLFNMKALSKCWYKYHPEISLKKYNFKHILCSRRQGQRDLTWMCIFLVVTSTRSWPWASAITTKTMDEAFRSLHTPVCSERERERERLGM